MSISDYPDEFVQVKERVRSLSLQLGRDAAKMEAAFYVTVNLKRRRGGGSGGGGPVPARGTTGSTSGETAGGRTGRRKRPRSEYGGTLMPGRIR